MLLETLLCIFVLYLTYKTYFNSRKHLPPGPWHIPYLGSKFPLTDEETKSMVEKYGDIFTCYLGKIRVVLVADFKLAKELFSMAELSNRPQWRITASLKNGTIDNDFLGLVTSNGSRWLHSRKFTLRHLRNLGMGKSRLEDAILFEVADLIKHFRSLGQEATDIPFVLNIAILNVIWQLVASHRFSFNDEEVEKIVKLTNTVQSSIMKPAIATFYPIFTYLMPRSVLDWLLDFNTMIALRQEFYSSIWPFVEDHKKTLDLDNPRDLIDDYFIAMKEEESKNETSFFDEDDLMASLFDLFLGGSDTVANAIKWFILYMAEYQLVQDKARREIDEVVPRGTLPSLEHRASLTYVDALMNEVLRMSSFFSKGLSRTTSTDIKVRGYDIPKDTMVTCLAAIQHGDRRYWDDPEEFKPERFLDSRGKVLTNKDGHSPFGLGRRQCLGEPLARMELYLLGAALLQNFAFSPVPGQKVDLKPKNIPFMHWPPQQKIVIKPLN